MGAVSEDTTSGSPRPGPIVAGVFPDADAAERRVRALQSAGFPRGAVGAGVLVEVLVLLRENGAEVGSQAADAAEPGRDRRNLRRPGRRGRGRVIPEFGQPVTRAAVQRARRRGALEDLLAAVGYGVDQPGTS